jgi:hypothetical protein
VRDKDSIYTFIDRTHMTFCKKFKVQSKIKDLRTFYDMYIWTKNYKKQEVKALYSDTITHELSEDQWQCCCITFDSFYGKNKVHDTGIFMPSLVDDNKESLLLLSTGIFEPTIKASLTVIIKGGLKFIEGSTFCHVYHYYYGRSADETIPVDIELDDDGEGYKISYSIKYPLKNAKYKLVWKFEGD